jgi:hypothetical protein
MYVDKWTAKLIGFYKDIPIVPKSRRAIYNGVSGKPVLMTVQYDLKQLKGEVGMQELTEVLLRTRESAIDHLKASKKVADQMIHEIAKEQAEREKSVTYGVADALRNTQIRMKPSAVRKVRNGMALDKEDYVVTKRKEPAKSVDAAIADAVQNAEKVYKNSEKSVKKPSSSGKKELIGTQE